MALYDQRKSCQSWSPEWAKNKEKNQNVEKSDFLTSDIFKDFKQKSSPRKWLMCHTLLSYRRKRPLIL